MPIIRVRKRTRQNREDRVRRRALIAIAISMGLFALFHVPDAIAGFSGGARNPALLTSSPIPPAKAKSQRRPGTEETNLAHGPSFASNLLDSIIAPEPGTFALVGVGIAAFGLLMRKRAPG